MNEIRDLLLWWDMLPEDEWEMTNTEKRSRFFHMMGKLIVFASDNNIKLVCFEYFRSTEKQKKMFAAGKSLCDGIKSKSKHFYRLAMDLVILKDGKFFWPYCEEYRLLGEFWESLGGTWGHRWYEQGKTKFDDIYHFQY